MFKKKLGMKPKTRTIEEINKDYNFHATQAGHKQRIITEITREIDNHVDRMLEINAEAKLLPPPAPAQPTPTPIPKAAGATEGATA